MYSSVMVSVVEDVTPMRPFVLTGIESSAVAVGVSARDTRDARRGESGGELNAAGMSLTLTIDNPP